MEWMNLPKEPAIVARQVVWVKMRSHPWWPAQVNVTLVRGSVSPCSAAVFVWCGLFGTNCGDTVE